MNNSHQISEFIEKYNIKTKFKNLFENLLENNTAEELNIKDKNIYLEIENLHYLKTKMNYNSFQTNILKNNIEIGVYKIVFDNNAKVVDEFFIINENKKLDLTELNKEDVFTHIIQKNLKRKFVITPINILKSLGFPVAEHNYLLKNKNTINKLKHILEELNKDGFLEKRTTSQDFKGIKEVGYNITSNT